MRSQFVIKLSLSIKRMSQFNILSAYKYSIMLLNYIEFTYELLPFLNSNKSTGLFSLLA